MIFLAGADLVLPDRVVPRGTLVVDAGRFVDILEHPEKGGAHDEHHDLSGRLIVPGFIDGHVHGIAGHDVLDGPGAVAAVSRLLPRWGVTSFCPTSIACEPAALETLLGEVGGLCGQQDPAAARVLPAHLESNFISPEYRGAQPLRCLRLPADARVDGPRPDQSFTARDVLMAIDRHRDAVGIITLAPEIPGGLGLVRAFADAGVLVSLGHSGATFEQAHAAIAAGASRATHLFNRMSPMTHREPGLVGAILGSDHICAELICDGHHVHPAVMRLAVDTKGAGLMLAVTDGTAGSGLPAGTRTQLGGQPATVGDVARLDDGTIAGSVATMDRVLEVLVRTVGIDLVEAVAMCTATPARHLNLSGFGVLAEGAAADFAVLGPAFEVAETWVAGRRVYARADLQ